MMNCMGVLKYVVGDYANKHGLASTSTKVEGRTERYTGHYESSGRPGL